MILLPAIGSQLITTTSLFLMPVLITSVQIRTGVTEKAAGLLLSMELVVSAITTLYLSAFLHGRSTRRLALMGAFLAIAGTALTLVSPVLPMLFLTRLIAGIGAGMVGAKATSVLSRGIDRERLIALVTIASITNAAMWLALIPYFVDRLGYRGPYVCILLICMSGAFLLRRLPSVSNKPEADQPLLQRPFNSNVVYVITAIFLTQLGQGAFWSMEEVFGNRAGFSSHTIGLLLSIATLLLLLGAVAGAWVTNRSDRFLSLFILISANAISIVLISTTTVHWIFIAVNVLQSITNLSSVICQLGLAANLDRTGRVVAASTSLVTLGNGLGPSLSANLSGAFGAPCVGFVVLAFNLAALILFGAVRLRDLKEAPAQASLT